MGTILTTILTYIGAALPVLFLCWLIFYLDRYEREDYRPLGLTLLLGMLCALPVLAIQTGVNHLGFNPQQSLGHLLLDVFIVVALNEEVAKLAVVLLYPFRRPFFNEAMDGIVYCMLASMGFALVENLLYAYNYGWSTVLVRAFTAVPAHAVFAVFMGYFVGLAKVHPQKRPKLILAGLAFATFIHGLYDFFIFQQYQEWLMGLGFVTVIVGLYLSGLLIRDHRSHSPFQPTVEDSVKSENRRV